MKESSIVQFNCSQILPERPPGRPPERPPGRRRNPPGRPFRDLGSGDLFSKSKTSLSSLSLSSFSSSMSASGSFL